MVSKRNAIILSVIHRIKNLGAYDKFALPFLVTVPQWLTWREFSILIYHQAKRFIDFQYFKRKTLRRKKIREIGQ